MPCRCVRVCIWVRPGCWGMVITGNVGLGPDKMEAQTFTTVVPYFSERFGCRYCSRQVASTRPTRPVQRGNAQSRRSATRLRPNAQTTCSSGSDPLGHRGYHGKRHWNSYDLHIAPLAALPHPSQAPRRSVLSAGSCTRRSRRPTVLRYVSRLPSPMRHTLLVRRTHVASYRPCAGAKVGGFCAMARQAATWVSHTGGRFSTPDSLLSFGFAHAMADALSGL